MNLIDILKPASSLLFGALTGGAGSAVGPVILDALAGLLGLGSGASEQQVVEALAADPVRAEAVIREAEAKIGRTVQEIEMAVLGIVNETAREELKSESWFVKLARPFNIWVIGVVTAGYGLCLIAATVAAIVLRDPAALNLLVANAGVLGIALAPSGAVAGVSAWGRTKEKLAGAENIVTGAINAIRKK